VKRFDFIIIGLPALLGGTLVAYFAQRVSSRLSLRNVPKSYIETHLRLKEWMIKKRILRFPGACLTDTTNPWVAGETVGIIILLSLGSLDRTAQGAMDAAVIGLLSFALTTYIGLLGSSREALRSVRRDLPVACFLLSLLLESGMGASPALQETAVAIPRGPLSRELSELIRARSLGYSRADSIDHSMRRVPLEDYRLFLNHIRQGERLGIGLSGSLRGLSEKMLEDQDHRAETIAQQAAVKMLFPLVCFIFPAVFLIILSPVILGLWDRIPA
jgi:pilus assembly protein TadC